MVMGADDPVVRVATRDKTTREGMALGVGSVALGWGMTVSMAIGAPMTEFGIGEKVSDPQVVFKPGPLRF
jgi:hypothetical protein